MSDIPASREPAVAHHGDDERPSNGDDSKTVSEDKKDHTGPPSDSDTELGEMNEKALLRKIDWKLLPAVGILYLLSFLDRSNGKWPLNVY